MARGLSDNSRGAAGAASSLLGPEGEGAQGLTEYYSVLPSSTAYHHELISRFNSPCYPTPQTQLHPEESDLSVRVDACGPAELVREPVMFGQTLCIGAGGLVSLMVPGPLLVGTGTDALMAHVSGSLPPRLEASPMDEQSSSALCLHLLSGKGTHRADAHL